jgi:hypothetical protein
MDRKVYFGNSVKQMWIPAPRTGLDASSAAFFSDSQLLSGRASVRRSMANHRRFAPTWVGALNADSANDSLHTIKDFFDGIYGDGPFYWLDPFAVDQNLLAPHWAAPMLSVKDWPSISSIGTAELVDTPSNTNNYPYKSLELTLPATIASSTKVARIILPAGYKLDFGWHGARESGDAAVTLRCYDRATGDATDINTQPIAVTSNVRTNQSVSGNTYSMVDVLVKNPSASSSVISIAGLIAQVRPATETSERGGFISGRGTMGMQFSSAPSISYLSAKINDGLVELATSFIEE